MRYGVVLFLACTAPIVAVSEIVRAGTTEVPMSDMNILRAESLPDRSARERLSRNIGGGRKSQANANTSQLGTVAAAGVVLAARSGSPIVAHVTVIQTSPDIRAQTVLSDSTGAFVLPGLQRGPAQLIVKARGFTSRSIAVDTHSASAESIVVRLALNARVRGRVIDLLGNPVTRASVWIEQDARNEHIEVSNAPAPRRTRVDGTFEIESPAGESFRIVAQRQDCEGRSRLLLLSELEEFEVGDLIVQCI